MGDGGAGHAQTELLYGLPLEEFTAARDELARRLRKEGASDAAVEVKRLTKPSVAAWALNQVRRSAGGQVDDLIEAGRRLREAQEGLLKGGGRKALQEAGAEERRLVGELARLAERALSDAGRPVSAAVAEKLRATLHAAASDPEARERLAAGTLVRDHEVSGLGPLADTGAAPPRRRRESRAKPGAALERKARRLEERLEQARARLRELEEASADAERKAREARREAARAAGVLARAEKAEERSRARAGEAAEAACALELELRELRAGGDAG